MSFRRICLILTVVLIVVAGLIWILNIENIIKGPLSNPISALFTILAVLFAFIQVFLLISPVQKAKPNQYEKSTSSNVINDPNIPLSAHIMDPSDFHQPSYEDYVNFLEKIKKDNPQFTFIPEEGKREAFNPAQMRAKRKAQEISICGNNNNSLIIYTSKQLEGIHIYLVYLDTWLKDKKFFEKNDHYPVKHDLRIIDFIETSIGEDIFNHKHIYSGCFLHINPGTYVIWYSQGEPEKVNISEGKDIIIDWRTKQLSQNETSAITRGYLA